MPRGNDYLSMLPDAVVAGVLKSAITFDGQILPDSVEGINAVYEQALGDEQQRDAALVAAQPMLKSLIEQLYSSRSVRVGLDAFGRAVAVAVNGQDFDSDQGPWVVDEIEIPGRAGSGVSRSFNQPMWERQRQQAAGVLRRSGRRGRGRMPDFRASAVLLPLHQSTTLQGSLLKSMDRVERDSDMAMIASLADNAREFDPDGGQIVILDASVVLAGMMRKGLPECVEVMDLALGREIQVGMTPPIAADMTWVVNRDTISVQNRTHSIGGPEKRRLIELVRNAVNVADGGSVSARGAPRDVHDFDYVLAARRIAGRGLKGTLVERDRHFQEIASELPPSVQSMHPKDFIRLWNRGKIR